MVCFFLLFFFKKSSFVTFLTSCVVNGQTDEQSPIYKTLPLERVSNKYFVPSVATKFTIEDFLLAKTFKKIQIYSRVQNKRIGWNFCSKGINGLGEIFA